MDLTMKLSYPAGGTNLPIVVVMHGFSQAVSDFDTPAFKRFARYGAFCAFVEMRGRGSSDGTPDVSAREIYDIVDAVTYIITTYADIVDADNINLVGYSGGGGNAYAVAAKFPDLFNTVTAFFGISDYGHDVTDGWYQNGATAGSKTSLETWIGDNPTNAPKSYHARAHVLGVTNYTGGYLWIFHDDQDTSVPIVNTTNVTDALDAAALTNYADSITTVASNPRWTHSLPIAGAAVIRAETTFMPVIVAGTHAVWTIAASGTVTVLGYIVTKRFTIWLRATGGSTYGLDAAATVAYNTTTDTYTITPLTTGGIDVTITQGAKTGSATNITAETAVVVA